MDRVPDQVTIFAGRVGDRNPLAMAGVELLGTALATAIGASVRRIGTPGVPLGADWSIELPAATPELHRLAFTLDGAMQGEHRTVTVMGRCSASLATLPVVAHRHPAAAVVWFDAHGDCNMPEHTTTGYLGGIVLTGAAGKWDSGLGAGLSLGNVILVGSRDLDPSEQSLVDAGVIKLVEVGPALPERLRQAVDGRDVYIHIDCDVLEPGLVPTEYQVANGLSFADLHAACAVLAESKIVGVELTEFQERWPDGRLADVGPLVDAIGPIIRNG